MCKTVHCKCFSNRRISRSMQRSIDNGQISLGILILIATLDQYSINKCICTVNRFNKSVIALKRNDMVIVELIYISYKLFDLSRHQLTAIRVIDLITVIFLWIMTRSDHNSANTAQMSDQKLN